MIYFVQVEVFTMSIQALMAAGRMSCPGQACTTAKLSEPVLTIIVSQLVGKLESAGWQVRSSAAAVLLQVAGPVHQLLTKLLSSLGQKCNACKCAAKP